MDNIIGQVLETARQHFLGLHGYFYKGASVGDRKSLETWLKLEDNKPIKHSVDYAAALHGVDDPQILEEITASMKFRILAGILTRPVENDTESTIEGGFCAHQEYDPETDSWPCKVPSNQSQADKWHERFGHGKACPFYKKPEEQDSLERIETELEKMLNDEGLDLEEAWSQLGLRQKRD